MRRPGLIVAIIVWSITVASLTRGTVNEPFEDVTASSGIDFVLKNAATPEKHQIETMAGGVAVLDFDNDGLLDIFFSNGARQPALDKPDASWHNRLFRNLGNWRFEDVTAKAGLQGEGFGFGAAAADYDNDGHTDLFVAALPRGILYRNRGNGTFEKPSNTTSVTGGEWPIAAGWFDYDGDGRLDLFVVNYVRWDAKAEPFCGDLKAGYRTYCHPKYYTAIPNTLYRNNGNGTFTDVSAITGIARHPGKGMGVAFADYDNDGDTDVFVANDTVPNFLFRNHGRSFTEVGMQAGIAFNDDGRALSSMGVDFRDIDNNGREDLFVSALSNETFPVYRNIGKGLFADITYPSRVGAATMPLSGWSNGIFDFDNDGWKDLFVTNGDVQDNTELFSSRKSKQQQLLLLNNKDGAFRPVLFGAPAWHRGAAFADFDNDGRIDIVITRLNERPVLLRNRLVPDNHWIGLRAPLGTRVRITTAAGDRWNHATTSVGYASSSDPRIHFGLGSETIVKSINITFRSGQATHLENVAAGRYIAIEKGVFK